MSDGLSLLFHTYRLDDDLMVCRHCRRRQQITWREHAFPHGFGCRNVNAEPRPWLRLVELIEGARKAGADDASMAAAEPPQPLESAKEAP